MAFHIKKKESVGDSIRRIAREQTGKAINELNDASHDSFEKVHQVRKRCKKIRGLIRLVCPALEKTYERENAWYRDAARSVSFLRDAQTVIDTLDSLQKHYRDQMKETEFSPIRKCLVDGRRKISLGTGEISQRLAELQSRIQEGRDRIADWKFEEKGFEAISPGLLKTYQRGQKAMDLAQDEPSAENFHQWRKRVKYHRYHARLLRRLWKPVMDTHRDEAKRLSDLLGDSHDLVVLEKTLVDSPRETADGKTVESLLALADRRRVELRAKCYELGQRLYAEKPSHLKKRIHRYWKVWRDVSDQPKVTLDSLALSIH